MYSTSDAPAPDSVYANFKTIRRNGSVVAFEPGKISVAMSKAFLAVAGSQGATSARIRDQVAHLTEQVVSALMRRKPEGGAIHIEEIQDQVELALMRSGEHDVARAYVLYREERSRQRALRGEADVAHVINVVKANGERQLLDVAALKALIKSACAGLEADTDAEHILSETLKNLYDGVAEDEVNKSAIMAARAMIEKDPSYNLVTSRLLLNSIRLEILGEAVSQEDMAERYAEYFPCYIKRGVAAELLDEKLGEFDLERLGRALVASRDTQFGYLGLQTLYDRYFLHIDSQRIELPQAFYMRVAMGLALNEIDREARAIEFYIVLSTFDFMSSTPTLFNAGTRRSQLSSCYLTTIADDLDGIY